MEFIGNASLHIMGSRSFQGMGAYWQTSADPFAPPMNQIPKAVFSRQGPAILGGMNTTAVLDAAEIAKLKAQEGKPIIAHGGVSFARSLVTQELVDQFALIVAPVALGKGLPLFSELAAPAPLKLMSSKAFPGGAVAQIYRSA